MKSVSRFAGAASQVFRADASCVVHPIWDSDISPKQASTRLRDATQCLRRRNRVAGISRSRNKAGDALCLRLPFIVALRLITILF
jgi:hypothetical protein